MVKNLISISRQFQKDVSGATAIEYGLIAAGIAVVIIGALALVGNQLTAMFAAITAALGG